MLTGQVDSGLVQLNVQRKEAAKIILERNFDGIILKIQELPFWMVEIHRILQNLVYPSIKPAELCSMLRDMAVMTSCGVPIMQAIQGLAEEDSEGAGNRNICRVAKRLLEELDAGAALSEAFERNKDIFPESVCSLITIGDKTGTTHTMLMEAANHLDRVSKMKAETKQAMIYPIFVFMSIFGVAAFWIYYVIPNLLGLFKQLNAKLPPLTLMVLNASEWMTNNGQWLVASMILIAIFIWLCWQRSVGFQRFIHTGLHKIPITRSIVSSAGLAFFSEYLSILIRAGLNVSSSLSILENATRDLYYKERLSKIKNFVEKGDQISVAMKQVGGFPPMMLRMIIVGENSGTLDNQLKYLAGEYADRLKQIVSTISEIIKPLIIVVAGGVFLFLIIALMLPVYDLVKQSMSMNR